MKIASEQRTFATTLPAQQASSFQINASPKAFQILSDSLYQKKELAILRELTANAYDAHIAAGREDTPFVIHMPTPIEPYFEVKDFGTGLSDQGIHSLYTTYFGSNKNDSNDFVGGLGLGSKSPFAYTDQFSVESRYEGYLRSYHIYRDNDGVPKVTLVNTRETEEPNGLTVRVPIGENGHRAFRTAARTIFPHVPMPLEHNLGDELDVKKTEYIDEYPLKLKDGAECLVKVLTAGQRNSYSDESAFTILMGIIPYPVTGLKDMLRPAAALKHLSINVEVPIGLLDIAASRESLSYNTQTLTALDEIALQIAAKIASSFNDELKSAASLPEFLSMRSSLLKQYDNFFGTLKRFRDDIEVANPVAFEQIKDFMEGKYDKDDEDFTWNGKTIGVKRGDHLAIRGFNMQYVSYRSSKLDGTDLFQTYNQSYGPNYINRIMEKYSDDDTSTPRFYWAEKRKPFRAFFEEEDVLPAILLTGPKAEARAFIAALSLDFDTVVEPLPTYKRAPSDTPSYGAARYYFYKHTDRCTEANWGGSITLNEFIEKIEDIDGNFSRVIVHDAQIAAPNLTEMAKPDHIVGTKLTDEPIFTIAINDGHHKKKQALLDRGAMEWKHNSRLPAHLFKVDFSKSLTPAAYQQSSAVRAFINQIEELFSERSPGSYYYNQIMVNMRNALGEDYFYRLPPACRRLIRLYKHVYSQARINLTKPLPELDEANQKLVAQEVIRLNARYANFIDDVDTVLNDHMLFAILLDAADHNRLPTRFHDGVREAILTPIPEATTND